MSQIYCVSHKNILLPKVPNLQLIQVGNSSETFAPLRDNQGDNIAEKNATWSENTALYAVWKNQQPGDAVGFCHYRRFLLPRSMFKSLRAELNRPYDAESSNGMYNYASGFRIEQQTLFSALEAAGSKYSEAFDELLENHEIVLPHPNPLKPGGFLQQYVAAHPAWPLFDVLSILSRRQVRLGRRAFEFFTRHEKAYWNNLFVMRYPVFDRYCNFLFPLLTELEQTTPLPEDPYQQRVFAFLSERLLNFWIWNEKLKATSVNWCMTEAIESGSENHQRHARKSSNEKLS